MTCLLLAAGALVSAGCAPGHAPVVHPPLRRVVSAPTGRADIRLTDAYRQAEHSFHQRQYRLAAQQVAALTAQPGLGAPDRQFLLRQRDICLRYAAGAAPAAAAHTGSAFAPGKRRNAHAPMLPDCGPRALLIVCRTLGVRSELPALCRAAGMTGRGTSMQGLAKAAHALGLSAQGVQASREGFGQVKLPAIAWVDGSHYVALLGERGSGDEATVTIEDPNDQSPVTLPREELLRRSNGYLLLLARA